MTGIETHRSRQFSANIVFYGALTSAIVLCLITSSSFGEFLAQKSLIASLVQRIAALVPAVNGIADRTSFAAIASFTIALQWIFFPIYLGCMLTGRPPWKPLRWREGASKSVRRKGFISSLFIAAFFLAVAISDFGFGGVGFLRGTIFSPDFPTLWLRLPYEGRFGLAIASVAMPLFEAYVYWILMLFVGTAVIWILSFRERGSQSGPARSD